MKKAKVKAPVKPEEDQSAEVTREEREMLGQAVRPKDAEDLDISKAALDARDDDDEALNEGGDLFDMGQDLDVPGSELDDDDEFLGEEDEENNNYSQSDN